jgi:hypothetical protein
MMAISTDARGGTMTEEYLTAKQVAKELEVNQRELRKFLRHSDSPFEAVGQGARYQFDREDADLLKEAFNKHIASKKTRTRKVDKTSDDGEDDPRVPDVDADGIPWDQDPDRYDSTLGDAEPDDDELEEIEFEDDEDFEVLEDDI